MVIPRPKLQSLAQRSVFRAREAERFGVARVSLQRLAEQGILERVDRGLYAFSDAPLATHQSFAEVASRHPKAVVCLLSALRFHELTTENPAEVYVFVPQHAQRPRMENQLLRVFWVGGETINEGIQEHDIGGVTVRITNPAKTVVDCFKFRSKIGINVAAEALRDAWQRKLATADDLWKYAELCRMTQVMRPYFEMLVA
jgi:predicted transcriptional regulator of viral defense system